MKNKETIYTEDYATNEIVLENLKNSTLITFLFWVVTSYILEAVHETISSFPQPSNIFMCVMCSFIFCIIYKIQSPDKPGFTTLQCLILSTAVTALFGVVVFIMGALSYIPHIVYPHLAATAVIIFIGLFTTSALVSFLLRKAWYRFTGKHLKE